MVLLMVTVLCACGDQPTSGPPSFDHSPLDPIPLEAEAVVSQAPAIGQPTLLRFASGYLWVSDAHGDPGLHIVDPSDGEILYSVGREGEGPSEFSGRPFALETQPGDQGGMWAWDLGLQRLSRFEARPLSEYDVELVKLQGVPPVHRVAWVTQSRIIGVANSHRDRFVIYRPDGTRLRSLPGPILGTDEIPLEERLRASNEGIKVCTWPGRGFVIANFKVGRIELYDSEANFVRQAEVPFGSEPIFEPTEAGSVSFRAPRSWYFDCSANDEYLFALFSGRLKAAYEYGPRYSGDIIHVFGWDGRLKSVFELDRDIRAIAVDQEATVLYGASLIDANIYRFDLPQVGGDR